MKIQQMNIYDYLPEIEPDPEKGCGTCRFWTYMWDANLFVCNNHSTTQQKTAIDDYCEYWEKKRRELAITGCGRMIGGRYK